MLDSKERIDRSEEILDRSEGILENRQDVEKKLHCAHATWRYV
jgi:hypothetical protein